MKRVWKHAIPVGGTSDRASFMMPFGTRPVAVGVEGSITQLSGWQVVIWSEVDVPGDREWSGEERHFQVFGTGHEIPDTAVYIGTVRPVEGLVLHVYEVFKPPFPGSAQ